MAIGTTKRQWKISPHRFSAALFVGKVIRPTSPHFSNVGGAHADRERNEAPYHALQDRHALRERQRSRPNILALTSGRERGRVKGKGGGKEGGGGRFFVALFRVFIMYGLSDTHQALQ